MNFYYYPALNTSESNYEYQNVVKPFITDYSERYKQGVTWIDQSQNGESG